MMLELSRQLERRFWATGRVAIITTFIAPIFVAILVVVAYTVLSIQQEHRNSFIYFTTMYGFWLGLFGTCQAVNGEVSAGEWCYWVLGCRRGVIKHVSSIILSGIIITFLQCITFCLSIIAVDCLIYSKSSLYAIYLEDGAMWQYCRLVGMNRSELLAISLMVLSVICSSVSGVFYGVFLSAIISTPTTSQRVAVAFMIIMGIASAPALHREDSFPLIRIWASNGHKSAYLTQDRKSDVKTRYFGKHRGDTLLEDLSLVMPQRYYFNIGRALTGQSLFIEEKKDDNAYLSGNAISLIESTPRMMATIKMWFLDMYSLKNAFLDECIHITEKSERDRIAKSKNLNQSHICLTCTGWGYFLYWIGSIIFCEVLALALLNSLVLVCTFLIILNDRKLYELR